MMNRATLGGQDSTRGQGMFGDEEKEGRVAGNADVVGSFRRWSPCNLRNHGTPHP